MFIAVLFKMVEKLKNLNSTKGKREFVCVPTELKVSQII
jgi:hypothetical protein